LNILLKSEIFQQLKCIARKTEVQYKLWHFFLQLPVVVAITWPRGSQVWQINKRVKNSSTTFGRFSTTGFTRIHTVFETSNLKLRMASEVSKDHILIFFLCLSSNFSSSKCQVVKIREKLNWNNWKLKPHVKQNCTPLLILT
jgi:hypothetical protein